MEQLIQNNSYLNHPFRIEQSLTVRDLLKKLNLLENVFVILMDGKSVTLDTILSPTSEIIILPKIAGGFY